MRFYREKTEEYFLADTRVENMFIHEFMAAAPDRYVKVYLLALMHADLGVRISREEIARHLSMDEEDVLKAWTYWEQMGVIRKRAGESGDKFDYDVEFVSLRQQMYGSVGEQSSSAGGQIGDRMTDPEVKGMISEIEQITGRVFSSTEIREVLSWLDEYQVPPESVAFAFAYCKKTKRKTDPHFVGGVLRRWAERGLRDLEAIEEHLGKQDRRNTMHKRVFQALGFPRNATEEERRIMDSWFEDMGLSLETVLMACNKTSGITNPNINYVNKVLVTWKKEGKIRGESREGEPTPQETGRYYEAIRQAEAAEAERRLQEVYGKVPRVRQIDEELSGIGPELSRLIISDAVDRKKKAEDLRQKEEELRTERAFLLTDNEFDPDYTDLRYRCPICKDTGRLETGEACQCSRQITREQIEKVLPRNN